MTVADWLTAPTDTSAPPAPRPNLRTIPGVELVRVGRWEASTGEFAPTPADLVAAVAAHRAGVLRKPVLHLGHDGPMRDGAPALGYVDNLRTADGGQTLIGDLVNVPAAVATLIPHAYPDRSVEALLDYRTPEGVTYSMVLTGLALLGAAAPAVETLKSLQDVGELYGVPVAATARRVILAAAPNRSRPQAVAVAAARRRRRTHRITHPH